MGVKIMLRVISNNLEEEVIRKLPLNPPSLKLKSLKNLEKLRSNVSYYFLARIVTK